MNATLRGISGPGMGLQALLKDDLVISVGRNKACTLSIPSDHFLSGLHFEITVSKERLLLRDPGSSNGTFINDTQTREQVLKDRDSIRAGQSIFQIHFDSATLPSVVDVLSSQSDSLYAILDAARDPVIYPLLLTSGAQYICLYSGKAASELEAEAPYLVHLPPRCELLEKIVTQGWSKSWGVFLTSGQSLETIWHELRRSLMVTLEDTGKYVYFRFYDPRVLRLFLPMADPQQMAELVGTMSSLIMEDEDPAFLLRFHSFPTVSTLDKLEVLTPMSPPALPATLHASAETTPYQTIG